MTLSPDNERDRHSGNIEMTLPSLTRSFRILRILAEVSHANGILLRRLSPFYRPIPHESRSELKLNHDQVALIGSTGSRSSHNHDRFTLELHSIAGVASICAIRGRHRKGRGRIPDPRVARGPRSEFSVEHVLTGRRWTRTRLLHRVFTTSKRCARATRAKSVLLSSRVAIGESSWWLYAQFDFDISSTARRRTISN